MAEVKSAGGAALFGTTLISAIVFALIVYAQPIEHLYAPRPPAGSAYVRAVNVAASSLSVRIGSGPSEELSSHKQVATIYRIVPGDDPLVLETNGRVEKRVIVPPKDRFVTLIAKEGPTGFDLAMTIDDTKPIDGLRAELRFYNTVEGCSATLGISDGPRIFDSIPAGASRYRTINPVEANLYGECGSSRSSVWKLPSLKPGDHYSLFLLGDPKKPVIVGQLDQTEPYRKPEQ